VLKEIFASQAEKKKAENTQVR